MIYFFFLVGPEKFKTKVINNTVNPEWNEVFEVSKEDRSWRNSGYEAWSAVQGLAKISYSTIQNNASTLERSVFWTSLRYQWDMIWLTADEFGVIYSLELGARKYTYTGTSAWNICAVCYYQFFYLCHIVKMIMMMPYSIEICHTAYKYIVLY